MRRKYSIGGILEGLVGYRGIPFPGALTGKRMEGNYKGDEYELSLDAPVRNEYIKGTKLYAKNHLGRWYFMPVTIKHSSINTEGNAFEIPDAILSITGKKNIVETNLVERKGTIKELISLSDYKISIAGWISSNDGSYPEKGITQIREIFNINESVELVSVLTDLIFDDGDKVVITDISFPQTPGIEDAQAVKIECVTDRPFELIL